MGLAPVADAAPNTDGVADVKVPAETEEKSADTLAGAKRRCDVLTSLVPPAMKKSKDIKETAGAQGVSTTENSKSCSSKETRRNEELGRQNFQEGRRTDQCACTEGCSQR